MMGILEVFTLVNRVLCWLYLYTLHHVLPVDRSLRRTVHITCEMLSRDNSTMHHGRDSKLPTPNIIPHFVQLVKLLPYIPLDVRKALMTIAHVGEMPWQNSRLRQNMQGILPTLIHFNMSGTDFGSITLIDFITDIQIVFSTPVLRSITSMYLRCVPLADDESWVEALEKGKRKELSVTQSEKTPSIIYPFLGSDSQCRLLKMHQLYPFRPQLNQSIRYRLISWKRSLTLSLLLPTPSLKTVGEHSSTYFNDVAFSYLAESDRPTKARTTVDFERFYAETGLTVPGPSEVRYSWMYNVLKPRVYYAQGGEAYFESRYISPILDSLSRSFRSTDPHHRYSFADFGAVAFDHQRFLIYDYSSFTSLLADIKNFMLELGVFCRGIRVRVFDTHKGILEKDLGDIILGYNAICNNDPEFSVHRIEGFASDHPYAIVHHRVAGMLGIYGNIVGSTVLHGLSTISIVGNEEHVNTIGDDAGIKIDTDDISLESAIECIQVIGDVATEKFEVWEEDEQSNELANGWHYVKRPITVRDRQIIQRWMPDFPILARIMGISDGMHTIQPEDFITRRRLLIKQTCRLFDSMYRFRQFVSETDIETVLSLLRKMYVIMHLPFKGSFPQTRGSMRKLSESAIYPDSVLCTPALRSESVTEGWFSTLKANRYETLFVRVPSVTGSENLPDEFYAGLTFKSPGSKLLGLMEKIGVLSKESEYEEWLLTDEIVERLESLISGKSRQVYTFTVTRDYPAWQTVQMLS